MATEAAGAPENPEYRGPQARYYDQYFCGLEGEGQFYLEEALDDGGPVLELGCGNGRILLPIAAAGVEIVGLERSPDMLAQAAARLEAADPATVERAELVEGDMRSFDLGETFPLAICPYRTFQHLLTPEDQGRALDAIAAHLDLGGRLVYNTFDPSRDAAERAWAAPGEMELDAEFADPVSGRPVRVLYRRAYDLELQHLCQELLFQELDGESVVASHPSQLTLRYTYRYEMEHLLAAHGFEVVALYGYFDGRPYPGFGEQVWVAERR